MYNKQEYLTYISTKKQIILSKKRNLEKDESF